MGIDVAAVAICGHISSGKTSLTRVLGRLFNGHIVSFGEYVRNSVKCAGLPETREVCQAHGQSLIETMGSVEFLRQVVRYHQPASHIHLFDGVRHLSMLQALQQEYPLLVVIYLETGDRERYRRYANRENKFDPSLCFDEFVELSNAPAEQEVSKIASEAHIVIHG